MHRSLKSQAVSAFVACLMLFLFSAQALSGTITSWGYDNIDQVTDTPLGTNFTAIAGGWSHGLALSDGVVPEPSTGLLSLIGLALLPLCRRNLRRYSS